MIVEFTSNNSDNDDKPGSPIWLHMKWNNQKRDSKTQYKSNRVRVELTFNASDNEDAPESRSALLVEW